VFEALSRVCAGRRRVERFRDCGAFAWVYTDPAAPDRYSVRASCCHDRWCVPCARARAREVAARLELHCHNRRCLFVTLTLRSSDQPLADQLDRLYQAFARLRRTKLWTSSVRGGAAVCEVTYNHGRGQWHPHLHCIVEGSWLPLEDLRSTWLRLTGDSYVCDVRLASGAEHVAAYVCKYLSKPTAASWSNRPDQLAEAITAFTGRRLIMTFGTWHGVKLKLPADSTVWRAVAPLAEILRDAANRLPYAVRILSLLKGPLPWSTDLSKPP